MEKHDGSGCGKECETLLKLAQAEELAAKKAGMCPLKEKRDVKTSPEIGFIDEKPLSQSGENDIKE